MAENRNAQNTRSRLWLLVGLALFVTGAAWWLSKRASEAGAEQVRAQEPAYSQDRIDRLSANGPEDGGFTAAPMATGQSR